MSNSRKKPLELKSLKSARGEALAIEKMREISDAIWNPESRLPTHVGGGETIHDPERSRTSKEVPQTLSAIHNILLHTRKNPGKAIDALAKIYSTLENAYNHNHKGRDPLVQKFYKGMLFAGEKRLEGKDIFKDDPEAAREFDERRNHYSDEFKLYHASTNKEFIQFQQDMAKEKNNFNEMKEGVEALKKMFDAIVLQEGSSNPEMKKTYAQAYHLMTHTMGRMLMALSAEELNLYKKDFLAVLRETCPDTPEGQKLFDQLTRDVNSFCHHHEKLMTSLTSRYVKFGAHSAIQILSIAASPVIGATIPVDYAGPINTVTGAGLKIGEKVTSDPLRAHSTGIIQTASGTQTPSANLTTYMEMAAQWIVDNPATIGLAVSGVVASVVFPPAAPFIAGIGIARASHSTGSAILNAGKELKSMSAANEMEKKAHEQQFCSFMRQVAPEGVYADRIQAYLEQKAPKEPVDRVERWLRENAKEENAQELTSMGGRPIPVSVTSSPSSAPPPPTSSTAHMMQALGGKNSSLSHLKVPTRSSTFDEGMELSEIKSKPIPTETTPTPPPSSDDAAPSAPSHPGMRR